MLWKSVPYWENGELVVYDVRLVRHRQIININHSKAGFLLIAISLFGLGLFLFPLFRAELAYRLWHPHQAAFQNLSTNKIQLAANTIANHNSYLSPSDTGGVAPANQDFGLVIPKVGINSKILADVDPNNKAAFETDLKMGVAQARGTALPGQKGFIYLFGHSSDYLWNDNPLATLLYPLNYLNKGDDIYLVYQKRVYLYRVTDKQIVSPNDFQFLTSSENSNALYIQTCWPPNTDWQRLIITAKPPEA